MASNDLYNESTKRNRSLTTDNSRSPKRTKEGSFHISGLEQGMNETPSQHSTGTPLPPQHSTPAHGPPPGIQQFMPPHVAPQYSTVPPQFMHMPQPLFTPNNVTISSEDILKIAMAVKSCIHEDLKDMVHEITEPLQDEIRSLREENRQLKLQIDEVEQYSRRSLVRISGIPEEMSEDTTDKILEATSKAGIILSRSDIETSHRIGKPGNRPVPRQIIARMTSVDRKFQLLKSSKKFREHPDTRGIAVNEDWTRYRDYICFICRKLVKNRQIKKVWTTNGKIQIRDNNDKVHIIKEERDAIPFGHVP